MNKNTGRTRFVIRDSGFTVAPDDNRAAVLERGKNRRFVF